MENIGGKIEQNKKSLRVEVWKFISNGLGG